MRVTLSALQDLSLWKAVRLAVVGATALIFLTARCGLADDVEEFKTQIFVGNSDGSSLRRLVDLPDYQAHGSPSWSADGKWIAFDAWRSQKGETFADGHIMVVSADGSKIRDLGRGIMPSLSPQGHRVAFSRRDGGETGIWIVDVDDPTWKAQIDEHGWGTDWSPDGVYVAYTRGSNLVIYNMIEGTSKSLFDDTTIPLQSIYWNFSWSGDSQFIAFKAMTKENRPVLATVDVRGEKPKLTIVLEEDISTTMTWQPDRSAILVAMFDSERQVSKRLYTIRLDKPNSPQLLSGLPMDRDFGDPCLSPDGTKLAVWASKRISAAAK